MSIDGHQIKRSSGGGGGGGGRVLGTATLYEKASSPVRLISCILFRWHVENLDTEISVPTITENLLYNFNESRILQ